MAATVGEHLAGLPADVRTRVEELRRAVREVAPDAGEAVGCAMPVSTLDGVPLLHVGAWEHHVGRCPVPTPDPELAAEVVPRRSGQDTVRLPHAASLPRELLVRLAQAMVDRRG